MKNEILATLHHPAGLEKLYRQNKGQFEKAFKVIYPDIKGTAIADVWYERLNYEPEGINWGTGDELLGLVLAALVAGVIAKIPSFFHISGDFFYPRNIGFIVLPLLTGYFAMKNKVAISKIMLMVGLSIAALVYINLLPDARQSSTLTLSCIHLVIFLWAILGFAFVGGKADPAKRLNFLKYNGDLVVMTGLILIAGAIMSGITINLFMLIGLHIENFYFDYVGIFGLAAAPIVGTYLTQSNPQLVGKISPVIAKLFSPLVLIMLVAYLVAMIYARRNPYTDREFLLLFNALLIGVMAIIFFSVAETWDTDKGRFQPWILMLLSLVTIVVNVVALSAIVMRIAEWGFSPNRLVVLGGNVLILINLVMVSVQFIKVLFNNADRSVVGRAIAVYLPVYAIWATIVTFFIPLLFWFK